MLAASWHVGTELKGMGLWKGLVAYGGLVTVLKRRRRLRSGGDGDYLSGTVSTPMLSTLAP
mgnify:CR=1 FL=1